MANISGPITFSVITPTYNRANTLPRVYESLASQTYKNFEWIIVDDGSTDDTGIQAANWEKEAGFLIRYVFQRNAGKPKAVNNGISLAHGEYILLLDSDDKCVATALEQMLDIWLEMPKKQRRGFVGVTGLCKDQHGSLIGDSFPTDILDSDAQELSYRYKVKGEKWGFLRADVLRKIPQPVDADQFIPESVWWGMIAKQYKTRYVNQVFRVYYVNDGTASNQFSSLSNPSKYAKGHAYWHQWILNEEIRWFSYAPWCFIKSSIHYSRFSALAKLGLYDQYRGLKNSRAKILWLAFFILGFLFYFRDRYWK